MARRRRHILTTLATATVVTLLAGCAGVQGGTPSDEPVDYPTKSIQLTIPYPPGGGTDLSGRLLARGLEKALDGTVVALNVSGASGALGTQQVISAKPDGYELLLGNAAVFTLNPLVLPAEASASLDDVRLVRGGTSSAALLVVPENSPYQTIDDVLALADSDTKVSFGHTGAGSTAWLMQSALFAKAGIDYVEVPLDGGSAVVAALLGNQIDFGTGQPAELNEQIRAGSLRVLASFSEERLVGFEDVPTVKESGVDVVVVQHFFLAAPKDLPDDVFAILEEAMKQVENDPEYLEGLEELRQEPEKVDGETLGQRLRDDLERHTALLAEIDGN